MSESIRKYKPLKEIVINWGCVFGSFFTVLYIFSDINYQAKAWSFELGLILLFIEFMIFLVLAVTVIKYVRKLFGLEEERGIRVDIS